MSATRHIEEVFQSRPTLEGAGVRLRRAFGHAEVPRFDPFLMLDDFRGETPADYEAGFPWHPHRGMETITYMIEGSCEHGDSMGNRGVIGAGDVQWMTAGSGVIHQEMPAGEQSGRMGGFQLWANLPAVSKMMDARYRGVDACDMPVVEDGVAKVRIVAGRVGDVEGPVREVVIEPEYLDVTLMSDGAWLHPTTPGHTVFAYVVSGDVFFGEEDGGTRVPALSTALFTDGDTVVARSADADGVARGGEARFLLVSGRPLHEPIAWQGPIVMNTDEELRTAFRDYRDGTFARHGSRGGELSPRGE
ncbi:MAG: pirin family protein [Actinobacteria bacterium]|nr:pirin family protein [Actinomycetota bacterium]